MGGGERTTGILSSTSGLEASDLAGVDLRSPIAEALLGVTGQMSPFPKEISGSPCPQDPAVPCQCSCLLGHREA